MILHLKIPSSLEPLYRHLLEVFSFHFSIDIKFDSINFDFKVSTETDSDIVLSKKATEALLLKDYKWLRENYTEQGFLVEHTEDIDHLTSALFLLNCVQEYGDVELDALGRFSYKNSVQAKFESAKTDMVSRHFSAISEKLKVGSNLPQKASRIFVSHDIDEVNTAFLENGKYALMRGRIDIFIKLIFDQLMGNPQWLNMSQIMDVNDEFGLKSTFFWIVNQKRISVGNHLLRNADYSISDSKIREVIGQISKRGFEHGLHKGIAGDTFAQELSQMPLEVKANRNHFLRFSLPKHLYEIDQAGFEIDCSLGFAEQYGFRNSYSRPVHIFNLELNRPTSALQVPLNVMDTTNWVYKKQSLHEMKNEILSFIDGNKHDALISILWHNKYFSGLKFEGYLELYKDILSYCSELGVGGINQSQILESYRYAHS